MTTKIKTPEQIATDVIDATYGPDSDWAEPNEYGESGFTLAQVETDIDQDTIEELIADGITRDREQRFTGMTPEQTARWISDRITDKGTIEVLGEDVAYGPHNEHDFAVAKLAIMTDREENPRVDPRADALEAWARGIAQFLGTDKGEDWSEELNQLRDILPDLDEA